MDLNRFAEGRNNDWHQEGDNDPRYPGGISGPPKKRTGAAASALLAKFEQSSLEDARPRSPKPSPRKKWTPPAAQPSSPLKGCASQVDAEEEPVGQRHVVRGGEKEEVVGAAGGLANNPFMKQASGKEAANAA